MDGKHYESIPGWGGQEAFEKRQRFDIIKTTYCLENNIRLLRIKYTDFEHIQELIEAFLAPPTPAQPEPTFIPDMSNLHIS